MSHLHSSLKRRNDDESRAAPESSDLPNKTSSSGTMDPIERPNEPTLMGIPPEVRQRIFDYVLTPPWLPARDAAMQDLDRRLVTVNSTVTVNAAKRYRQFAIEVVRLASTCSTIAEHALLVAQRIQDDMAGNWDKLTFTLKTTIFSPNLPQLPLNHPQWTPVNPYSPQFSPTSPQYPPNHPPLAPNHPQLVPNHLQTALHQMIHQRNAHHSQHRTLLFDLITRSDYSQVSLSMSLLVNQLRRVLMGRLERSFDTLLKKRGGGTR